MSAPVRWSNLKHIGRSPAHYRHACDNPIEASSAMRVGAYAHSLVLGGPRRFAVYNGVRRGGSWELFRDGCAKDGTEVLNVTEATLGDNIARAIDLNGLACAVLSGYQERRIEWSFAGRACAGTPDAYNIAPEGPSYVTELKITADASPQRFPWHARKMGWLGQVCWYGAGLGDNSGMPAFNYHIVAVEAKPPHPVVVYTLTPDAIDYGMRQWRGYLSTLLTCEESNEWPGYSVAPVALTVDDSDVTITIDGEEITV